MQSVLQNQHWFCQLWVNKRNWSGSGRGQMNHENNVQATSISLTTLLGAIGAWKASVYSTYVQGQDETFTGSCVS